LCRGGLRWRIAQGFYSVWFETEVDALGLVHALILRLQALVFPFQTPSCSAGTNLTALDDGIASSRDQRSFRSVPSDGPQLGNMNLATPAPPLGWASGDPCVRWARIATRGSFYNREYSILGILRVFVRGTSETAQWTSESFGVNQSQPSGNGTSHDCIVL
jgi:hypothetical protein